VTNHTNDSLKEQTKNNLFGSHNFSLILGAIVLLVLVILVIVIFTLSTERFKLRQKTEKPTPSPVAKILSQKSQELKLRLTKTDKKSGDLILEDNPEFKIIYLISNDQFMVFVKKAPYEDIKRKAEVWFGNYGFEPFDLCLLKVSFTTSKAVKSDFSIRDAVPTGCPIPAK